MKKVVRKRKKKNDEETILIESAKVASSQAIRTSRALNLSVKVIKDSKIITINPDKSQKVERTISKSKKDISKLKRGMVLTRK